jgi:hypothetical protein
MRRYRFALGGVALAVAAALVAGCSGTGTGSGSASPGASATPARSATDELVSAAAKLRSATYKFTVKVGSTSMDGAADPSTKGVQLTSRASAGGMSVDISLLAVGTDLYAQIDGLSLLGINGDTWLHVDGTKIKSLAVLGIADPSDPTGANSLSKQIVTANKSGSGDYTGTLDLTKAAVAGIPVAAITSVGDKAKSVPFTASVDSQGRLTKLSFTVPAQGSMPDTPVTITYSDFGSSVNVTKPTSNVQEAPQAVYTFLGG